MSMKSVFYIILNKAPSRIWINDTGGYVRWKAHYIVFSGYSLLVCCLSFGHICAEKWRYNSNHRSRVCAVAQYAVLEANGEVNGIGEISHPSPPRDE